ncbi:GDP-D-glucose phosphorylase 1-like [Elysia marginata]|uniref:GDP-D-glucose phosphorylase 1 n=1 Tax=Elysia marginata TaxID=1093978 RepID=A0AAV4GQ47_9GAST|nr:GDP-D-glucose phosphorylase 1-like [Elysia marginata]
MQKIFFRGKLSYLSLSNYQASLKENFRNIRRMASNTQGADEIETYNYTEAEFIPHVTPWEEVGSKSEVSKFDQAVHERWDRAMANGVFRYTIDHIVTRIIPGSKQYVAQLNTLRATERRKPQVITSVYQPFNPKSFNFTWVKSNEVIFNIRKVHSPANITNGDAANSTVSEEEEKVRHCLVVNVSPMEYGHCLLLPEMDLMRPQVLTERALEVAVETMLLSKHRGFRLGFNSLCAFASVNHLHFHAYYLDYELIVDHCPVEHLGGKYYEFTSLPCPGFALQLHGSTVKQVAREAFKLSSYFHKADIAHNVYINRGLVFGEERGSNLTTIRLFIWPRKKYIGTKSSDEFNVASLELGGHLPIKDEFESVNMACAELAGHENFKEAEGYHKFTEEDVDAIVDAANLRKEDYEKIKREVIRMGLESVTHDDDETGSHQS